MQNFFCHKPWDNIFIEVNGDIYFCCFIIRPSARIGNLKKHSMEQAWRSRKAEIIRKKIAHGIVGYYCQICPYYGEFKHQKSTPYRIYFRFNLLKDLAWDFLRGGPTRSRQLLKLKKWRQSFGKKAAP